LKLVAPTLISAERAARAERLREAIALQELEGNPLTADEIEMFEMFDREGFSSEQEREFILALHTSPPDA